MPTARSASNGSGALYGLSVIDQHVYRYSGSGVSWTDVQPYDAYSQIGVDGSGALYGLSMIDHQVFHYVGGTTWNPIGMTAEMINVVGGDLYALNNSDYDAFLYEGGTAWQNVGNPSVYFTVAPPAIPTSLAVSQPIGVSVRVLHGRLAHGHGDRDGRAWGAGGHQHQHEPAVPDGDRPRQRDVRSHLDRRAVRDVLGTRPRRQPEFARRQRLDPEYRHRGHTAADSLEPGGERGAQRRSHGLHRYGDREGRARGTGGDQHQYDPAERAGDRWPQRSLLSSLDRRSGRHV